MDLHFASPAERLKFTCKTCAPAIKAGRRCAEPGYDNLKTALTVGGGGLSYQFCPGKATWSPLAGQIFEQCRLTLETGIMPAGPNLDDQDAYFAASLPAFIERWRERTYSRLWNDISEFASSVLKALFPK